MEILTFIRYALLVYIVNWHPFFSQFHNVVTAGNASFLSLRLGADVILSSQHVRVLGVVISADLGLEKHVSNVSATCFRHLHQLRHVWSSLSTESATTLVHAFVTSWIDYCNVVFVGTLKSVTKKLQ